jgi:hypothetical protein
MIVRIGSHRANAKLKRLIPEAIDVYEASFTKGGSFAIVPDERSSEAVSIKGISKVRDQNESHYRRAWKSSSLND